MKLSEKEFKKMLREEIEEAFFGSGVQRSTDLAKQRIAKLLQKRDYDIVDNPENSTDSSGELSHSEIRKYVNSLGDFLQIIQRDKYKSQEFLKTPLGKVVFKESMVKEILTSDFSNDVLRKLKTKEITSDDIVNTIKMIANNPKLNKTLFSIQPDFESYRDGSTNPAGEVPDDVEFGQTGQAPEKEPEAGPDMKTMKQIVKNRISVSLGDSMKSAWKNDIAPLLSDLYDEIEKNSSGNNAEMQKRDLDKFVLSIKKDLDKSLRRNTLSKKYGNMKPRPVDLKEALEAIRKYGEKLISESKTVKVLIK